MPDPAAVVVRRRLLAGARLVDDLLEQHGLAVALRGLDGRPDDAERAHRLGSPDLDLCLPATGKPELLELLAEHVGARQLDRLALGLAVELRLQRRPVEL